jgi:nucleoside-diphosphate-sugar epimerase
MKVLVTGGNGFIGRTLVRALLQRAAVERVDIVDNLSNSHRDAGLAALLKDERVHFNAVSVGEFQPTVRYTHVYHLASPVGPAGVLQYAGRMAAMIVSDTMKVAHYALAMGARMIDISTSEVYGHDPGDRAQREDIEKIVPARYTVRLEYGVAKLACEVALTNLAATTDLGINIIRPFNIVGVGQKGEVGFVLPRFVQQALSGKPLTVFGDGNQKRCFTAVDDIVEAILAIDAAGVRGQIFNVGNPGNISPILGLAELVLQTTGSASEIKRVDPKVIYGPLYEEAWNKIPDISKIELEVGWHPRRPLRDIVAEVVRVEGDRP